MKVFIFGSSGMLGTYLVEYLKNNFNVVPITRNEFDLLSDFNLLKEKYIFNSSDIIINAAGVIKQRNFSCEELITVNSLFPHFLSHLKDECSCKVIHITTDCVFSGKDGGYNEDALHDCTDDYGKSKSLGENKKLTIIRTSIIGEELRNKKSLLEWIRSKTNSTINGYTNHFWNGVTCLELSKQIENVIKNNSYWEGVKHYHSYDNASKYELVSFINEIYKLNNNIIPIIEKYCDRTLISKFDCPVKKTIKKQIIEMKNFII